MAACTALEMGVKEVSAKDAVIYSGLHESIVKLHSIFNSVSAKRQEEETKT